MSLFFRVIEILPRLALRLAKTLERAMRKTERHKRVNRAYENQTRTRLPGLIYVITILKCITNLLVIFSTISWISDP